MSIPEDEKRRRVMATVFTATILNLLLTLAAIRLYLDGHNAVVMPLLSGAAVFAAIMLVMTVIALRKDRQEREERQ